MARAKYIVVILTIVACALVATTFAAITINQNLASSGTIAAGPNVAVFSNSGCTTALTSISWGSIEAGGSATQTIYVENTGGSSMTLSISVGSWSPSTAGTYITISWTNQGAIVAAGTSVPVVLTLTVSSSVTGITSFSNTITVSGSG